MSKEGLKQQHLEEDFRSDPQNQVVSRGWFEKKQKPETAHLEDIIKRSKISPKKEEVSHESEKKDEQKEEKSESRLEKILKLKKRLNEHLNGSGEYEIELAEKDFKDQLSDKRRAKASQSSENTDLDNLRILDSFGGGNVGKGEEDKNLTSLEGGLMGRPDQSKG